MKPSRKHRSNHECHFKLNSSILQSSNVVLGHILSFSICSYPSEWSGQHSVHHSEVTCSNVRQKPALVVWFLFFSLSIIKWLDVSEANVTGAVMSKRKSALLCLAKTIKKSSGPYRVSTRQQDRKPKWEDESDNNSKENMTVCQRTHKVIWEWGRGAHLFLIPTEWVWELPKNPAEVLVWPKAFLEAITTSSARVENTSAENVNACKAANTLNTNFCL